MTGRLVIIPALNEAETIADVVAEAKEAFGGAPVLVIDDGSTDDTATRASNAGAMVISLPLNTGIGGAVQAGYLYAIRHRYDVVIRLDGDGQHVAGQAVPLADLVSSGEADVAIGSRFLDAGSNGTTTTARRFGIRLLSWLVRGLFSWRATDPTSGLWAVGRRGLEVLCAHSPDDFPEVESLAICVRSGLSVRELPARMRPRRSGRSSIGPLDSLVYLLKVTFALLVISIRRYDAGAMRAELKDLKYPNGSSGAVP